MKRYSRTRALGRSTLLMLAVAAPMLGFAVSAQNGVPALTIGDIPKSYADCEGPPPRPDWDACGNPLPTATPTATPTPGDD